MTAESLDPEERRRQHVVSDAKMLLEQSKLIQAYLTLDVTSRQIFMAGRWLLDHELEHGWEVDEPEAVKTVLLAVAGNYAVHEDVSAKQLKDDLIKQVMPILDFLIQLEEQADGESGSGSTVLPGSADAGET